MSGTEDTGFEPEPSLFPELPPPVAAPKASPAEAAWESYEASVEEPPFDENHHRYHTPARPLDSCANCLYMGWAEDEDRDRRIFIAGYTAGAAEAT